MGAEEKRERIIKLVKGRLAKYLKKCHKFGIAVPNLVKEAYKLDRKNDNTLWADAISKEMENFRLVLQIKMTAKLNHLGINKSAAT